MNVLEIFLLVICGRILRPISSTGARHGGDPVSVGLRFVCAAVRGGEEECLLRVHQTTHRPLQDHGLWQVRRDLCELPHECCLFLFIWGHPAFAIITGELWFLALCTANEWENSQYFFSFMVVLILLNGRDGLLKSYILYLCQRGGRARGPESSHSIGRRERDCDQLFLVSKGNIGPIFHKLHIF